MMFVVLQYLSSISLTLVAGERNCDQLSHICTNEWNSNHWECKSIGVQNGKICWLAGSRIPYDGTKDYTKSGKRCYSGSYCTHTDVNRNTYRSSSVPSCFNEKGKKEDCFDECKAGYNREAYNFLRFNCLDDRNKPFSIPPQVKIERSCKDEYGLEWHCWNTKFGMLCYLHVGQNRYKPVPRSIGKEKQCLPWHAHQCLRSSNIVLWNGVPKTNYNYAHNYCLQLPKSSKFYEKDIYPWCFTNSNCKDTMEMEDVAYCFPIGSGCNPKDHKITSKTPKKTTKKRKTTKKGKTKPKLVKKTTKKAKTTKKGKNRPKTVKKTTKKATTTKKDKTKTKKKGKTKTTKKGKKTTTKKGKTTTTKKGKTTQTKNGKTTTTKKGKTTTTKKGKTTTTKKGKTTKTTTKKRIRKNSTNKSTSTKTGKTEITTTSTTVTTIKPTTTSSETSWSSTAPALITVTMSSTSKITASTTTTSKTTTLTSFSSTMKATTATTMTTATTTTTTTLVTEIESTSTKTSILTTTITTATTTTTTTTTILVTEIESTSTTTESILATTITTATTTTTTTTTTILVTEIESTSTTTESILTTTTTTTTTTSVTEIESTESILTTRITTATTTTTTTTTILVTEIESTSTTTESILTTTTTTTTSVTEIESTESILTTTITTATTTTTTTTTILVTEIESTSTTTESILTTTTTTTTTSVTEIESTESILTTTITTATTTTTTTILVTEIESTSTTTESILTTTTTTTTTSVTEIESTESILTTTITTATTTTTTTILVTEIESTSTTTESILTTTTTTTTSVTEIESTESILTTRITTTTLVTEIQSTSTTTESILTTTETTRSVIEIESTSTTTELVTKIESTSTTTTSTITAATLAKITEGPKMIPKTINTTTVTTIISARMTLTTVTYTAVWTTRYTTTATSIMRSTAIQAIPTTNTPISETPAIFTSTSRSISSTEIIISSTNTTTISPTTSTIAFGNTGVLTDPSAREANISRTSDISTASKPFKTASTSMMSESPASVFKISKEHTLKETATTTMGQSTTSKPSMAKRFMEKAKKFHKVVARLAQQLGCFAIICSCSAILTIFLFLREFYNERCLHMSQELSLLIAHVLVALFSNNSEEMYLCATVSILEQFFMVTLFMFLIFESLHSYSILTNVIRRGAWHKRLTYQMTSVGAAAACVLVASIINLGSLTATRSCWVNYERTSVWIFTVFPIAAAFFTTAVFTEATGMDMRKPIFGFNTDQRKAAILNSLAMITLLPLHVASFAFTSAAVYHFEVNEHLYPFMADICCVTNTLLAIKLFIFHCLSNPTGKALVVRWWRKVSAFLAPFFAKLSKFWSKAKFWRKRNVVETGPRLFIIHKNTEVEKKVDLYLIIIKYIFINYYFIKIFT